VLAPLSVLPAGVEAAPAAGANPPQPTMAIRITPSFLKAVPANLSVVSNEAVSNEAECHDTALNFPVRNHTPVNPLKGPPEISLCHVSVYTFVVAL
jgi:hypothetical protein